MREMTITYQKPVLLINGQSFDVLKTDAEIVEDMLALDAEVSAAPDLREALTLKEKLLQEYLEKLLGKGAQKKIAATIEGLPQTKGMGLAASVKLSEKLIADAGKAYADAFLFNYGDE